MFTGKSPCFHLFCWVTLHFLLCESPCFSPNTSQAMWMWSSACWPCPRWAAPSAAWARCQACHKPPMTGSVFYLYSIYIYIFKNRFINRYIIIYIHIITLKVQCWCLPTHLTNPNINIVRVGGKLQHWRPGIIYIYIFFTTSSLFSLTRIMVNKGNHPKIALF